jgi:AraC-like DNA-binding protein
MQRTPDGHYDLRHLAQRAAMSQYHFLRVFRATTGITPGRFLAALRIEVAKRLLLGTKLTVTSICLDAGYESLGTFTRLFTEFVGASPTRFRALSDRLSDDTLNRLIAGYLSRPVDKTAEAINGSVKAPDDFEGVIFVGLFTSPIPQKRPLAGTIAFQSGRFVLDDRDPCRPRFVLAIAFPLSVPPIRYLLPERNGVLVASQAVPPRRQGDRRRRSLGLELRPPSPLDPPVLIALPLLLGAI